MRNIQNTNVSYFPSLPPFPFLFFRVTIHPYISTGPLRFCGIPAGHIYLSLIFCYNDKGVPVDHSAVTTPTYLGNMISAADNEALYDENAKLILADKSVLSWILRRCTNEFMNESLDTIRACI